MEQFETHTSQDFNEPYNEIAQALVHDLSSLKALRANGWTSATQRSFGASGRLILTSGARTISSFASRSCTDLFRSDDGSRRFRGTATASTAKTIWVASRGSFGEQESGSAQLLMMSRTWHATMSRPAKQSCESQATGAEVENAEIDSEGASRVHPGQAMRPSSCSSGKSRGSQVPRQYDVEEELQDATQDKRPEITLPAEVKKRPKYAPPWVRHRQGGDSDAAPELAGYERGAADEADRAEAAEAQPAQPSASVPQDVSPAVHDQNEPSRQLASEVLLASHAQGSPSEQLLPKALPAQGTPSRPSGEADLLVISSVTHVASLKASWVVSPETGKSDGVDASRHGEQTDGVASFVTGHAASAMLKERVLEERGRGAQVLETHKPPSSQVSNASLAPYNCSALGLLVSAGRFSRKVGASMGACAAPARKKKKVKKFAAQVVQKRSLDTGLHNGSFRPCLPPIVVVEHHHVHRHKHMHHTEVVEDEEEMAALFAASQAKAKLAKSVSLPSLLPAGPARSASKLHLQGKYGSSSMAQLIS